MNLTSKATELPVYVGGWAAVSMAEDGWELAKPPHRHIYPLAGVVKVGRERSHWMPGKVKVAKRGIF